MSEVGNLKAWAALLMAALAASVIMAVVPAAPAQAAPFSVTNTADSGAGSLRQAISDANASAGDDTIAFDPSLSGRTITLASRLPITDRAELTIAGGSASITVSGNNAVRVFTVDVGAKLTLNNLTVANGRGATGGGIYNLGTVTVNNSTLSGNSAPDVGKGGGGITNLIGSTLTVTNSTISGNSANYAGGAILNTGGTVTVTNSTISGNSATDVANGRGGGIATVNGGSVTLKNTIVANNVQALLWDCYGDDVDETGTFINYINGGHNLDSDGGCGFGTANNSLSGTLHAPLDPKLGPLADNGGPTLTHALLEGSPAIDKGNSFGATTDQRGIARPQGAASDMGAFEVEVADTTAPTLNLPADITEQEATGPEGAPVSWQAPTATDENPANPQVTCDADSGDTFPVGTTTVNCSATDRAGNTANGSFNVTVQEATAPEVSNVTPTGRGIGRGANISATFSEAMDAATIDGTTFKLFKAGSTRTVGASVAYDAASKKKAVLDPNNRLAAGTKYKAVVTIGAEDLAGNALDQNPTTAGNQQKAWTFVTKG